MISGILLAVILATASQSPSPIPPTPVPGQANQILAQDIQIRYLEGNIEKLETLFQVFFRSVYSPYCVNHGGLLKVIPDIKHLKAWPAKISCKNGTVVNVKAPN